MIRFLFLLGIFTANLAAEKPFELSATFLYLKPNIDDTHFVLTSFDNTYKGSPYPKGKRHQNVAPFTPGFCLDASYKICEDSSLNIQSTFFNAHSTHSVSGDFLYDTNGFPGFGSQDSGLYKGTAHSKNTYHFYAGQFTYQQTCFNHCTWIAGLHSAYIKFKEHGFSFGTFVNNDGLRPYKNNLHRNSQFWGIGPMIGLDFQYPLGAWAIKLKATGSLLCANTKSDLRYVTLRTGPGGSGVFNGGLWRITPAANADLSLHYILNCKCTRLKVELGYAFILYSHSVNKITGLDVAFPGDIIDVYNSFSLHGPYLRVGCEF